MQGTDQNAATNDKLTYKMSKNTDDIANLATIVTNLAKKVDNLTTNVNNLTDNVKQNSDGIANLTTKVDNLTDKVKKNSDDIADLTTNVNNLTTNVGILAKKISETNKSKLGIFNFIKNMLGFGSITPFSFAQSS